MSAHRLASSESMPRRAAFGPALVQDPVLYLGIVAIVLAGFGLFELIAHLAASSGRFLVAELVGWGFALAFAIISVLVLRRARGYARRLEQHALQFRTLADAAPAIIWTSEADGRGDYCNRVWFEFMGPIQSPLAQAWAEAIHPDDFEGCREAYYAALREHRDYRWEFRLRRHDGVYRWMMSFGTPRYDEAGTFVGYIGMCVDITEQREAAGEIRAALDRFDRAVEAAEHGIWEWDLATGQMYASPRFREMAGIPIDAPIDALSTFRELADPEDFQRSMPVIERAIAERTGYVVEVRLRLGPASPHAGSVRWFRSRGRAKYDSTGRAVCVTGSMRDITEDRRREQQLRDAKDQSDALARLAPVGIFRCGADGSCTYVNERWCTMAGMTAEEAQGMGWTRALHPDDRERTSQTWELAVAKGHTYYVEKRFVRPDGSVVNIVSTAEAQRDEQGNVIGYLGVAADVTQLKRAEDELRRALYNQALAAGRENLLRRELDHRVRNNLASLLGLLRLSDDARMDRAAVTERLRVALRTMNDSHELISRAHGESVRLDQLVRQILRGASAIAGPDRLRASGADIRIAPERVNALAMALQELATNSIKHGALRGESGVVELFWRKSEIAADRIFLTWTEECGRPIGTPASGSGLALVRNLLAADLEGSATFQFAESSLTCMMEFRPQADAAIAATRTEGVVRT